MKLPEPYPEHAKTCYPGPRWAERAATGYNRRHRERCRAYPCPVCGWWMIGRGKRRREKGRAGRGNPTP